MSTYSGNISQKIGTTGIIDPSTSGSGSHGSTTDILTAPSAGYMKIRPVQGTGNITLAFSITGIGGLGANLTVTLGGQTLFTATAGSGSITYTLTLDITQQFLIANGQKLTYTWNISSGNRSLVCSQPIHYLNFENTP